MSLPNLKFEKELWEKDYLVIGIDEVGRGAFAGPLVVGGVVFRKNLNRDYLKYLETLGINDSKKVKPNARKMLSKVIQKEALAYHVSLINVAQINRIGIGKASFMAMRSVVKNLRETLQSRVPKIQNSKSKDQIFVLVDKFHIKYLNGVGSKNQKGIVHGDCISLSIAAASIIAKVYRDDLMRKLALKYPEFGWGKNKGYGTLIHRQALKKYGQTKLHRIDFIEGFV